MNNYIKLVDNRFSWISWRFLEQMCSASCPWLYGNVQPSYPASWRHLGSLPVIPLKYRPDVLWLQVPFPQVCNTRCVCVCGGGVLPWFCLSWSLCPARRSWLQSLPADVWSCCPEVQESSPRNWTTSKRRRNKISCTIKVERVLMPRGGKQQSPSGVLLHILQL